MERKSTIEIAKTLRKAIENATHNHGYAFGDLSIERILVNEGPRYRRYQAANRGRANTVTKRTSHITVVLKTKEEEKKPAAAVTPAAEKVEVKKAAKPVVATKKESNVTAKKAGTKKK